MKNLPSKKVFYVIAQGVIKRILTIRRNLLGQITLDLFSGYLAGIQEKSTKIITRRYVISASKQHPDIHHVSGYIDSKNKQPTFESYFNSVKSREGFTPIFCERFTSLSTGYDIGAREKLSGEILESFDPRVSSLMLFVFIAYKDQAIPPLLDGIKISEYSLGSFKFLLITFLMDCPSIEYAWHIDKRLADPRQSGDEDQEIFDASNILNLTERGFILVTDLC